MPNDPQAVFTRWQVTPDQMRERVYRAPTPRERERWHALWLLSRGWSGAEVAREFGRDPHTIGTWLDALAREGPDGLAFEHTGGAPPPSTRPARPS